MPLRQLAVGAVPGTKRPRLKRRDHSDKGVDEQDKKSQYGQFHDRPRLIHRQL
jgi:hypothetical protein